MLGRLPTLFQHPLDPGPEGPRIQVFPKYFTLPLSVSMFSFHITETASKLNLHDVAFEKALYEGEKKAKCGSSVSLPSVFSGSRL